MRLDELTFKHDGFHWEQARVDVSNKGTITILRALTTECNDGPGKGHYEVGQYYITLNWREESTWRRMDPLEAQCVLNHLLGEVTPDEEAA